MKTYTTIPNEIGSYLIPEDVYRFTDFIYEDKLEEIYNGFKDLLTKSDVVKNKDYPFSDFQHYIKGYEVTLFSEDLIKKE